MSSSSNAPAINGYDIANYGLVTGTDKWWAENNTAAGSAKGQTFRTGSGVVELRSISYQVTSTEKAEPTKRYVVRVGKVVGSEFTQVYQEGFVQTFTWNGGEYMTWTFDTPVLLEGDTTYGVDVGMTNSTSGWQTGIPYINYTASEYSSGVMYSSGSYGVGTATLSLAFDTDRIFHVDLAVPTAPGFAFVGGNPADNSTNLPVRPHITASFNQDVVAGTGNITITNFTDNVGTVVAVTDSRVSFTANLLKIATPGLIEPYKSYAIRIDPGAVENTGGTDFDGILDDTTWNFTTGGDPLIEACTALKNHITGVAPLDAEQIADYSMTIDAEADRFIESTNTLNAVFSLIRTYDQVTGPLWVASGSFSRSTETYDMKWTIYRAMQDIVDKVYIPSSLVNYEPLLNGFMFGSSTNFPGPCPVPATNSTYTVAVNASFPQTFGRDTQDWTKPAARPTGTYLAPGTIATVTVPPALTNGTYKIRVGAHLWDYSNKPTLQRLDRTTVLYPITATETKIASPLGGGIYIEVPYHADGGIVDVTVTGAARAPFYSNTSYRQTTLTEWLDTERTNAGPWAVFFTDRFQLNVPRTWIYANTNAPTVIAEWDASMDIINDLMGFPHIRGKETLYLQADVAIRRSVFSPGYPTVNVGGANPSADVHGGDIDHYLVRGPQSAPNYVFHEQGHAYYFPKFNGESESTVNLLHVPVQNRLYGKSFDTGLAESVAFGPSCTMSNTAILWMTSFNFSPREVEMGDWEKGYQPQGHAKFVDLARLFGWEGLGDFWYYYNSNGTSQDDDADEQLGGTDEKIFRLSKSYGKDVRPLLHFWGIFPQNPAVLSDQLAAEEIKLPFEIRDLLYEYKSLVPTNNAAYQAFCLTWYGRQPTMSGYGVEKEHARQWDNTLRNGECNCAQVRFPTEIFDEIASAEVKARVQEIIDIYYETNAPTPNPMVFSVLPSGLNPTTIAMAGYATDVTRPVEYLFTNITTGVGRDWSSANIWTNAGLTPAATYGYMVKARDGLGNETGWSTVAYAVAETDITPPTPDPMTFAVAPDSLTANSIGMTATAAGDVSLPLEYYFENVDTGDFRTWSTSLVWTNTGLLADTTYGYRVKARDGVGNETAWSAVAYATTEPPILSWDSNGTGSGRTDGGNPWLNANLWWDGAGNLSWVDGSEAVFGTGGTGGAVTLTTTTAVYRITLEKFSGTYTIGSGGQTITLNAGISMSATASTTTIISPLHLIKAQNWVNNSGSLLTVSAPVNNGGHALTVGGTGSATVSGAISGGGGLAKTGTGVLNLSGNNSYTGATTVNEGVVRLSHPNALPGGPLALGGVVELATNNFSRSLGAGTDQFQVTGGAAGFSAQGAARFVVVSNDPNAELAWNTPDFNPSTFVLNHTTANNTITLSNKLDLAGANRTIEVRANSATIVGAIRNSASVAGLTKTGGGTLTLSGSSTYNGGTVISQGVLAVTSDASLGDPGGEITFTGTAKFHAKSAGIASARNLTVGNELTASILVGDTVSATYSNAGLLTGRGQLVFGSGAGGGTKTLILSSVTNDFRGAIFFDNTIGGTTYVLEMNSLSDSATNILFQGSQSATFRYGAGAVEGLTFTNRYFELGAGNTVGRIENAAASNLVIKTPLAVTGTGNKTLTLGGTGGAQFAGNIQQGSSTLSLTKAGGGTWYLGGNNYYSGATLLEYGSGPLVFQGLQALPAGSPITMRQNSSASSHLWLLDDRSGTITMSNELTLDHGNAVLGMTIFVGNNSTNNGGTSFSTRTGSTIALGKLKMLLTSANLSGFAAMYGANNFRLQFNGVELPAFTSGSGAWTAHFIPVSAFVTLAGTIQPLYGSTVARTPILQLDGSTTNNLITGNIHNAADITNNANALPVQLTKSGTSEWRLSGTNNYSGPTTINSGTLTIFSMANVGGGASAIGAPTNVANGTIAIGSSTSTGMLRYAGIGHTSDRVINLAGTTGGAVLEQAGTGLWKLTGGFTATGAGKKVLTLTGSTAGIGEIAGSIVDNSTVYTTTVVKVGSGTWVLSGVNSYRGATLISNGTLLVHGVVSGAVTAVSGATLGGTGTVGNVTINSGGTISPGASPGTLTVSNLTLAGVYRAELRNNGSDQIVAGGSVNLTGATLSVTNIGSATDSHTIINKTSSGAITGTFTGWAAGATNVVNGVKYSITYSGGDGNDVVLTVALSAGYTAWQIAKFGSSTDPAAGPAADPDSDGVVNVLEYAFDRDPLSGETTPLVAAAIQRNPGDSQEYVVLTFVRRKDDPELLYTPQISGNLTAWNAGPTYAELISQSDLNATLEEVQFRMKGPISQTTLQYARVAVNLSGFFAAARVFAAQRMILIPGQNYVASPLSLTTHTLGALLATNRFAASDTEASATVVDFWDQSSQTMGARYFMSSAPGFLGWRKSDDYQDGNELALDAAKGLILTVRPGMAQATNYVVGPLPRTVQAQTVQNNGYTLAGSPFPAAVSPAHANLTGSGFVGGTSLVTSDNLLLFNPATQLFDVKLWYDTTGGVWRDHTGAVATQQLQPGNSFLIRRRNRGSNFTWTNPVPYSVGEVWP
jgi:autotransporter-associated beta strand protein